MEEEVTVSALNNLVYALYTAVAFTGDWTLYTPVMFTVKLSDAGGDTITLLDIDGKLYPDLRRRFGRKLDLNEIKSISIRPDDVMICAYPKCGTHWVWEIVRYILAQTTDLPFQEKEELMLEFHPNSHLEKIASPRILNCHLMYERLPSELLEKKCKIIYVYRNLKDAAVSYYHHHKSLATYEYSGQWRNYLPLVLDVDYGSWFDYVRDWEELIASNNSQPILPLFYENIKQNPHREVSKIAKFLDKSCSDEFVQEVCDMCHFDVMKRSKYSSVMFRKGEVGDWKNYFTVSQNEMFERIYAEKMAGSTLEFKYEI